jgi:hypothetical protein
MQHLMDHEEAKSHAMAALNSGLLSFLKKYGATPADEVSNARKAAEAIIKRDEEKTKGFAI